MKPSWRGKMTTSKSLVRLLPIQIQWIMAGFLFGLPLLSRFLSSIHIFCERLHVRGKKSSEVRLLSARPYRINLVCGICVIEIQKCSSNQLFWMYWCKMPKVDIDWKFNEWIEFEEATRDIRVLGTLRVYRWSAQ